MKGSVLLGDIGEFVAAGGFLPFQVGVARSEIIVRGLQPDEPPHLGIESATSLGGLSSSRPLERPLRVELLFEVAHLLPCRSELIAVVDGDCERRWL